MPSFQSSGGGLEQPMLPSQPPLTNAAAPAKRKMPEDGDPFRASKKLKNDVRAHIFSVIVLANMNYVRRQLYPRNAKVC